MRQLDSRTILGTAGKSVSIYLTEDGFSVDIEDGDERAVENVYLGGEPDRALDAFRHTFAVSTVEFPVGPARRVFRRGRGRDEHEHEEVAQ